MHRRNRPGSSNRNSRRFRSLETLKHRKRKKGKEWMDEEKMHLSSPLLASLFLLLFLRFTIAFIFPSQLTRRGFPPCSGSVQRIPPDAEHSSESSPCVFPPSACHSADIRGTKEKIMNGKMDGWIDGWIISRGRTDFHALHILLHVLDHICGFDEFTVILRYQEFDLIVQSPSSRCSDEDHSRDRGDDEAKMDEWMNESRNEWMDGCKNE